MEGGNALRCLSIIMPVDLAHCRYRVSLAFWISGGASGRA